MNEWLYNCLKTCPSKKTKNRKSKNKHEWIPIKYMNVLQHKSSSKPFFNILQKYYQLPTLGTLDMSHCTSFKNNNDNL